MPGERRDVRRPFPQRRDGNADDIETEPQVGAKPVGRHFLVEPAVGRGDDAGVDAAGHVLAHAADLAVLQHAQQLGLRAGGQLADFIEKDRAAIGLFEQPRALADSAGEGPARVAEELGLEQIVGERGAVDRAEPAVAPRPEAVHAAGDELLAAAALPFDEHGIGRAGGAMHGGAKRNRGVARAEKLADARVRRRQRRLVE